MKRIVATVLMAGAAGLSGCDKTSDGSPKANTEASAASTPGIPLSKERVEIPSHPRADRAVPPLVEGAPTFAVLYPGGEIESPPTLASSADGPGGLVAFRTDADPDTIVAFYRTQAEAAGLSSVMAMNMGEALSYGAAQADTGASLQVVASPVEGGQTSVQLTWSAGG